MARRPGCRRAARREGSAWGLGQPIQPRSLPSQWCSWLPLPGLSRASDGRACRAVSDGCADRRARQRPVLCRRAPESGRRPGSSFGCLADARGGGHFSVGSRGRACAGGSRRNDVHAELISKLLTPLEALLPPEASLGVVTPYRGQARRVGRALQASRWKGAAGTVHSLQGEGRDLVMFDTVEATGLPLGRFFGWHGEPHRDVGARLLNVGLSRARTHLIVLADVPYLEGRVSRGAPFGRLLAMARERGLVIEATAFLE
ncbi:AAA domain-containing protein [Rhodovibrio sodomensis]|uniref:AAA domain-containing protein n=1 Tax=Rhodovibrio sodomensis TaxID=1088 RepID=UPI0030842C94